MNNFLTRGLADFFDMIFSGVNALFNNPNISYGLAIIVFTIIIRVILLPLNMKQMKSQIRMQAIQPEVKKLQEKYKNDPQKSQQEMMKLYKERGVNPMGGCLPLIIQLPILWALFAVFNNIHTRLPIDPSTNQAITVSFLWVKNLFHADQYKILPILSGLTTYLSSLMMTPKADGPQAKQTSTMNIGMSIMMVVMAWNFSAALVVYWVSNNLIQIAQTVLMKKMDFKKQEAA